jgi:hypothetical protein
LDGLFFRSLVVHPYLNHNREDFAARKNKIDHITAQAFLLTAASSRI